MNRALVLSGGGAFGAYEAGIISELVPYYGRTDSPVNIISGTSVGALNAALIVQGLTQNPRFAANRLLDVWRNIKLGDIYKKPRFGKLGIGWRLKRGLPAYDSRPLMRTVYRLLDTNAIIESPATLLIHTTDLDGKRQVTFTNDSPELVRGVVASASLPGVFAPISVMGRPLVDGGVIANTPIHAAIKAGADELLIVYLDDEPVRPRATIEEAREEWGSDGPSDLASTMTGIQALARSTEIVMTAHLERDLRLMEAHNQLIAAGAAANGKRHIAHRTLRPASPLGPPGSTLNLEPAFIRELLRRGRRDARKFLSRL